MGKIFVISFADPDAEQYIKILEDQGYKENENYFKSEDSNPNPIISEVTIPSIDEIEKIDEKPRPVGDNYWLRSPGNRNDRAAFVYGRFGDVDDNGIGVYCMLGVRPALKIPNLDDAGYSTGDRLGPLAGYTWTVISNDMVLCDDLIGRSSFDDRPYYRNADNWDYRNTYDHSVLQSYVDNWAKENDLVQSMVKSRLSEKSIKKINEQCQLHSVTTTTFGYGGGSNFEQIKGPSVPSTLEEGMMHREVEFAGYDYSEVFCIGAKDPTFKGSVSISSKTGLLSVLGLTKSQHRLWEYCSDKLSDIVRNGNEIDKELIKEALLNEVELTPFIRPANSKGHYSLDLNALRKHIQLYGIELCRGAVAKSIMTDRVMSDLSQGLDVSKYLLVKDHRFALGFEQIDTIRKGLELGLDVSVYADPKYNHYQMRAALEQMAKEKTAENERNIKRRITGLQNQRELSLRTWEKVPGKMSYCKWFLKLKMFNGIKEDQLFSFGGYKWQKIRGTNIAVCADNMRFDKDFGYNKPKVDRWFWESMIKMSQEEIDSINGKACNVLKKETDEQAKDRIAVLEQKSPEQPVISEVTIPPVEEGKSDLEQYVNSEAKENNITTNDNKNIADQAEKVPIVDIDAENRRAGLTEYNAEPDVILSANQNIAIKLAGVIEQEAVKENEGIYSSYPGGKSPIIDELQTLLVQYGTLDNIIQDLGKYGDKVKSMVEERINVSLESTLEKNSPEVAGDVENALQLYSGAINSAVESAKTQKLNDIRNDISSDVQALIHSMVQDGLVKNDGLTFDHESSVRNSYVDLVSGARKDQAYSQQTERHAGSVNNQRQDASQEERRLSVDMPPDPEREQLVMMLQNPNDKNYHVTPSETGVMVTREYSEGELAINIKPRTQSVSVSFNGQHVDMKGDPEEVQEVIGDKGYKLVMNVMDVCRASSLRVQNREILNKIADARRAMPNNKTMMEMQARGQTDMLL